MLLLDIFVIKIKKMSCALIFFRKGVLCWFPAQISLNIKVISSNSQLGKRVLEKGELTRNQYVHGAFI